MRFGVGRRQGGRILRWYWIREHLRPPTVVDLLQRSAIPGVGGLDLVPYPSIDRIRWKEMNTVVVHEPFITGLSDICV